MTDTPKHALQLSSELRPSKFPKITQPNLSDDEEDQNQLLEGNMLQNPRLQRYLAAIEYIGTRFCSSQKHSTVRTVSGALEDAFQKFIGQPVSVFCSSRTVRLLVGVTKAVGTGDLLVSDVQRILDAKDVSAASAMAPAYDLYLGQVKYDLPPSE